MANATGFVLDRSISPPKVLGMCFLISRSRAVCCASDVFHYVDAPWALNIHFPHPDVTVSIKNVSLHNEFDKPTARQEYLKQTGSPSEQFVSPPNDIAMLVIDAGIPDLQTERIAELNRALSLPFSSSGVEASGNVHGHEFLNVINNCLENQRKGLLTLFDQRNIPLARIELIPGGIQRVFFQQPMAPEMAFCELVYRKPIWGFAFEPTGQFDWAGLPNVSTPADRLIWEAMRRANEIPKLFAQLGGTESRYQKVVQTFDPTSASDEIQWMVERLWNSLDGYLTIDKMPERLGTDTYTVLVAVRELVNRGVISQINRKTPFHCSGQMPNPLTSHTDMEVNNWDPLQLFYLDNLSGKPCWLQGNYFGVVSALQPKNMLHTIPAPPNTRGALILKDYKLIGVHSGPQQIKAGQPAPPVKCCQFMWMGALLDLQIKKMRTSTESTEEGEQTVGTLRKNLDATETIAAMQGEKILCPTCFATNPEYGVCINCGGKIDPPPEEPEPTNPILKSKPVKELRKLQKKYGLTDMQLKLVGIPMGIMILFSFCGMVGSLMKPGPKPAATQTQNPQEEKHGDSDKAVKLAVAFGGLKATALPTYWFEDTAEVTKPLQSFGLYSKTANQKVIFAVYDDMSPAQNLDSFLPKPPFADVNASTEWREKGTVQRSTQILGDGELKWACCRYPAASVALKGKSIQVLVGGYPAKVKGKAILVIGKALDDNSGTYDYKTTLDLIEHMAEAWTSAGNINRGVKVDENMTTPDKTPGASTDEDEDEDETEKEAPIATTAEVAAYLKDVEGKIQAKLSMPEDALELLNKDAEEKRKKPRKWKLKLKVGFDEEGNVKKLEWSKAPTEDLQKLASALEAAVNGNSPYPKPPKTSDLLFKFQVVIIGDKVKVDKPDLKMDGAAPATDATKSGAATPPATATKTGSGTDADKEE